MITTISQTKNLKRL